MRVVLLASGEFALPTMRWLAESDCEVPLVVTQPARPGGRGRRLTPTPARARADELGLRVIEVGDVNAADFVERLRACKAGVGLAIAFGQMLGEDVLGALPGGCLNLHASLLPKYRGAAPINWAIVRGEERTGCTVFRIVRALDAGPVISTRWTFIKPDETAGELHDRLAAIGVDAVRDALGQFAGGAVPDGEPQVDAQASRAPKLKKSDGAVRFDREAARVVRHVLGMTPWPGAAVRYEARDERWEKLNLVRARVAENPSPPDRPPGEIDARRYVAAQDGYVEILEVKPSSGRIMTWADYVNGRHVGAGDRLVTPTVSG